MNLLIFVLGEISLSLTKTGAVRGSRGRLPASGVRYWLKFSIKLSLFLKLKVLGTLVMMLWRSNPTIAWWKENMKRFAKRFAANPQQLIMELIMNRAIIAIYAEVRSFYLRVVHSQAILFLKSMSERGTSDIDLNSNDVIFNRFVADLKFIIQC